MSTSDSVSRRLIRCRAVGASLVMGAVIAASAGAQQTSSSTTATSSSTMPQCPPGMVMSNSPLARPASGMTNATGATGRTDSGTGVTATFGAEKPDTLAARVSSVSGATTRPDSLFTGLNKTNGANGTGVTPKMGGHAMGAPMCMPANANAAMPHSTTTNSAGDVEMSHPGTTVSPSSKDSAGSASSTPPKKH